MNNLQNLTELNCLECDAPMDSVIIEEILHYKDAVLKYKQPIHRCPNCKEDLLTIDDLKATEILRADFIREVDGLLKTNEIRQIRKRFFHTQKEAGFLLGGGPVAFSRYEKGIINQSRSTDVILRLLLSGKIKVDDLRGMVSK